MDRVGGLLEDLEHRVLPREDTAPGRGMSDANFYDVQTDEEFWVSGPKRDRTDTRYGPSAPEIDPEAVETYHAFLEGAPLPGRENG